ncbi:PREDICTED: basic salivary proline-rich protein 2-like [Branchiostoma belcheri]|uniref:Basic salivary proline-rich protein 2-like n=1 Tax=Branchiostoma belcheri TaxID=7741 RepID=A0A6P4YAS0_BRABE|nr:PREDICTED: basic salivary proline-rich protein 2-like [Branchiostoma belcheri]
MPKLTLLPLSSRPLAAGFAEGKNGDIFGVATPQPLSEEYLYQNVLQPPTVIATGKPHHTYAEIPDDTPIDPYAETSQLENPVYAADLEGPRGTTSNQDPHPQSNKPNEVNDSSSHQSGMEEGKPPEPPPRSDKPSNGSDSDYYPPGAQTTVWNLPVPKGLEVSSSPRHGAASDTLQKVQPPPATIATGNPLPIHHTYAEIPDDTPIDPYAETSQLENPVYAADLEGPRGATSNQDPHPRSNKPNKASRKEERKTTNPPPKSDRPGKGRDYYPPDTTKVVEIPDPLTQNHAYANSNVLSQPRGLGTAPSPHHKASSNTQGLGTEGIGEVEGPNIYLDLNDPSLPPSSEKTPEPRTHTNVNSSQPKRSETEEEEGVNIYLDLNVPPLLPSSEKARDSQTHTNIKSPVPQGSGTEEEDDEGPNIYLDSKI